MCKYCYCRNLVITIIQTWGILYAIPKLDWTFMNLQSYKRCILFYWEHYYDTFGNITNYIWFSRNEILSPNIIKIINTSSSFLIASLISLYLRGVNLVYRIFKILFVKILFKVLKAHNWSTYEYSCARIKYKCAI